MPAKSGVFSHFIFLFFFSISDLPLGGTAPRDPVRRVGVWVPGSPVQQSAAGASSLARSTAFTRGAANPCLTDTVCRWNQRPGGTVLGLPVIVRTPLRYHQRPRSLVKTQTLVCPPHPCHIGGVGTQAAALTHEAVAATPHTFSLAVSSTQPEPMGLDRWANVLKLDGEYNCVLLFYGASMRLS